jgi:hypothetical protein
MNDTDNRRSEFRLSEQATIFIELQSADYDNGTAANILICNSLDLSANGMQIQLDCEVPVGSIFRLCVDFANNPNETKPEAIYLVGEVRWLKPFGDEFTIGFALFDSEQTDIEAWKRAMAQRLSG